MDKFRIWRSHILLLWAAGEMKIQNVRIELKIMSIVCAFVLSFFSFVPHPFSHWGPKPQLYMVKIQNGLIGAKIGSIVCALFVLAGYVIFSLSRSHRD